MAKFALSRKVSKRKTKDDILDTIDEAETKLAVEPISEPVKKTRKSRVKAKPLSSVEDNGRESFVNYSSYRIFGHENIPYTPILNDKIAANIVAKNRFITTKDLSWEVEVVPEYVKPSLPVTHATIVNKMTGKQLPYHLSFYGVTYDDLWASPYGIRLIQEALKRHKLFDDYTAEPRTYTL